MLPLVTSMLDKLARKKCHTQNKAANLKSGLKRHVKSL
jgi:ribosomal protein S20